MAGLRVIRGPDWDHGTEDGGDGHLGTLVDMNGDSTADVVWDNGNRTRCKIGKDGKHELLIFDNATVGARHTDVTCDVCNQRGIYGMRWKCTTCKKCDLCSLCYVRGKHDLTHEFYRFSTPRSDGVKVKKRSASQRIQSMGIFPGATVVRGADWKWGSQDGGAGSKGEVVSIEGTTDDSATRNVVRVRWTNGRSNIYRVGANDGKMDLKFVDECPGTYYYKDHLPCVDGSRKVQNVTETEDAVLKDEDAVYIKVSADVLKAKQKERVGWTGGMADCIGKRGVIKGFTPSGDVMVDFDGLRFRFFPGVLQKVQTLSVGDIVRISTDVEMVKVMQKSCGGWVQRMSQVLGKCGKVIKVDSNEGVAVAFGQMTWVFNPACCTLAPGNEMDDVSTTDSSSSSNDSSGSSSSSSGSGPEELKDMQQHLLSMLAGLMVRSDLGLGATLNSDVLYLAIVKGDANLVRTIAKSQPRLVNEEHKTVTPLIIASKEGQMEIVKILLENGARTEATDDKGNTALCYALNGKKGDVAKLLLDKGAKANVSNNHGRTPLHFAAYDNIPGVMKQLIQQGCPVNAQDDTGDTALHDAIQKGHNDCVDIMCRAAELDLTVSNKKGFNPLMLAALRDNSYAVERILQKDKSTTNSQKNEDKYAPLHIAAVNNHVKCARLLIDKGNAVLDITDNDGVTPLHLACHEAYYDTVELLMDNGARTDLKDKTGNTPLHLAVAITKGSTANLLAALLGQNSNDDDETRVRIACLLLKKGAAHDAKNRRGKTPLEIAKNDRIRRGVELYIKSNTGVSSSSSSSSPSSPLAEASDLLGALNLKLPCAKCLSTISDITVKPCGHKVLCRECCLKVERCPICETFIERRIAASKEELEQPCKVQ